MYVYYYLRLLPVFSCLNTMYFFLEGFSVYLFSVKMFKTLKFKNTPLEKSTTGIDIKIIGITKNKYT